MTKPTNPSVSKTGIFFIWAGIVLAVIALLVEIIAEICVESIFNPVPTIPHVLLVGFVPFANIVCLRAILSGKTGHSTKLVFANGIALGVSGFYTLFFLPLVPVGIIGIIFYGLGLLLLSPLLALVSSVICWRHLKRLFPGGYGTIWGLVAAVVILFLLELPQALTGTGMRMAASESEKSKSRGVHLLRLLSSEEDILRMCYGRTGRAGVMSFFTRNDYIFPEKAREIYYRVTGTPFNSVPPPEYISWGFDDGRGGESVAGKIENLSLAFSGMDASLDPDAALGYLEWTLVFKNQTNFQQEARSMILLPPGGVVSRLTLWVDGREREAAFAARRKVRDAYNRVVSRRRDPVLVTTSGPDRILVQCFPVPSGGEMKIRIGVTAPFLPDDPGTGVFLLPCFLETNFHIPDKVSHNVWAESETPVAVADEMLKAEHPRKNLYALKGAVGNAALSSTRVPVRAGLAPGKILAWTPDPLNGDGWVIVQKTVDSDAALPERVIVVVDGSAGMKKEIAEISESLRGLPSYIEFGLLHASDDSGKLIMPVRKGSSELYEEVAGRLKRLDYLGGQDNTKALELAWDLASEKSGGAVVWIHAAQPVLMGTAEGLRQKWKRRPGSVKLFDVQVTGGPNRILEELDGVAEVESTPFFGKDGPKKLFAKWRQNGNRTVLVRESVLAFETDMKKDLKTSSHLARLRTHDRILELCASGKEEDLKEAVKLASAGQLVTPVSGAVVLENDLQYEEAGLTPASPSTVPTIPEPEITLLLVAAAAALAWAWYRRKRECAV